MKSQPETKPTGRMPTDEEISDILNKRKKGEPG